MLADERAKIALPDRLAVVIQRAEPVMLRFVPDHIEAVGIDGGRGGCIAVELVPRERAERKIAAPDRASVFCIQTEHGNAAGFVAGGREENPLTPQHGRGVAGAGEFDFPVDVCLGDFGGDRFGLADAGAIRATKSGPFLRDAGER